MKISLSALFLALGVCDAFTSLSPSNPALKVLQMSRGTEGYSSPDIPNAPWGSPQPRLPIGHANTFPMGESQCSTLVSDGPIDRKYSGFGAGYYRAYAPKLVGGELSNPTALQHKESLRPIPM